MSSNDLHGGTIRVYWPYTATGTINITNGGTVTTAGVTQSFPQALSANKAFDFPANCTPTVTVTFDGRTLLSATYNVQWSEEQGVQPVVTWDADQLRAIEAPVTDTTTNLASLTSAINTDPRKKAGYRVFNTTSSKSVYAAGTGASALWLDHAGATAHTPV